MNDDNDMHKTTKPVRGYSLAQRKCHVYIMFANTNFYKNNKDNLI